MLSEKKNPNRLIQEKSPYLLQHAHNPVDWYPWGAEALEKARCEDKPILLSIGYSACHWCHVMARESFADTRIAALMNDLYVNIKVDREERPDLDSVYQAAAQLMSGQGGWPLTVFLTPDLQPFYAGTYFPPEEGYGRLGFAQVLRQVRRVYDEEPTRVWEVAADVTREIARSRPAPARSQNGDGAPSRQTIDAALRFLARHYDRENGGFGDSPKFPNTANIQLFLQQEDMGAEGSYADMACFTLQRMAAGGICDQLGGGFHRYSTDEKWLVPHFEKMLYDNALLPPLYLHAFQLIGDRRYMETAGAVLDYVLAEMTQAAGGFYAAQDADTEGEEGRYYVWSLPELTETVGEEDAALVAAYYGVGEEGNFANGFSVLYRAEEAVALAARFGMSRDAVEQKIHQAGTRLLAQRRQRTPPFRDEKVIAAWNGLMIAALAGAGRILARPNYIEAAAKAADFVDERMRQPDGRLGRTWTVAAGTGVVSGFLSDYAAVSLGLIDLYEATHERLRLERAAELLNRCIELFWDESEGCFFMAEAKPDLILRPQDVHDQSLPSGNALAARALLRLAPHCPQAGYKNKLAQLFRHFADEMTANPWGTAGLLCVLDESGREGRAPV